MGEYTVPAFAAAALAVWSAVLALNLDTLRAGEPLPPPVREASLLALYIALGVGFLSSLGFVEGVLPGGGGETLAAGWRAAVLVCGVYAFIGAARARRR